MVKEPVREFVETSSWARGLTPTQRERVLQDVSARPYCKGATVCVRLTPSHEWLGVVEGMLKVETITDKGSAATFAGVPAGSWLGEGAVLKGEPRPYDVVAMRDSLVAFVPRSTFMWLLEESHPFALWLIQQLNARLGYYVSLVQSYRLNDTTAQVAFCLVMLFNDELYPTLRRRLSISQEEIGRLSGVSRQIANQALRELHERGIIRLGYGSIEVVDLPALHRLAHGTSER